jgi:hypothetical protein
LKAGPVLGYARPRCEMSVKEAGQRT